MDPRFKELCENRKAYVQIAKKNGFYEGLKQLLTQLYPDSAHFVFELLQNAEDAGAQEVQFMLYPDRLEVKHDGQRLFEYSDVKAITGISQSTKKDDGTAIGKFGIGFKSIYAYTSMPEIYSGEYRFSISDSFIPVPIKSARYVLPGRTLFVLPFDNPDKDASRSYSEISDALANLNFSSLLFLKNIKMITYSLDASRIGRVVKRENAPFTKIFWRNSEGVNKLATFLCFQKNVEIEDDSGAMKLCNIGIAYRVRNLDPNKEDEEPTFLPMNPGEVSIYFPAVKETSNLKFNINAPFAATVARDSVRSCADNEKLRDALAELAVESIRAIRDLGLLNVAFLACLPNEKDELPPFYEPIRQRIVQAFREEDLTPLRKGGYAPARILHRAPARISEVFPDAQFAELMGLEDGRVWAANAPQKNQREDNFLDSLGMKEWSLSELASFIYNCDDARNRNPRYGRIFEKSDAYLPYAENLERLISFFSDEQLFSFYAILGEGIKRRDLHIGCDNLKLIRTQGKGRTSHVRPSEAYLPADGLETDNDDVMYVKSEAYKNDKRSKESEYVLAFLDYIGVPRYDIREKIRIRLNIYKTDNQPDMATHLDDLRLFMKYARQSKDFEIFEDANFILAKREEELWCKPSMIALDVPWRNTHISPIALDIGKYSPATLYEKEFGITQKSREKFSKFLYALGCYHALAITQTSSIPWEIKCRMRNPGTITRYCYEVDYVIDGLEKIISNITVEKSLLIWECLLRANKWQAECSYRPNASAATTTADASFIRQLKEAAWLPDKNGKFHKPGEITLNRLPDGFRYNAYNACIEALDIGANAKQQAKRLKELDEQARADGYESQKDKEEWQDFRKEARAQGLTLKELRARMLSKPSKPDFPQCPVANPERRKQKARERAEDAPEKSYERRERSVRVSRSRIDPRSALRSLYTNENDEMICQICCEEMPFRDRSGQAYFEAVELFDSELVDREDEAMFVALCPTCAAKYKEFVKSDSRAMKNLLRDIERAESHADEFSLELDGKREALHFVEKHLIDLVTVLDSVDIEKSGE